MGGELGGVEILVEDGCVGYGGRTLTEVGENGSAKGEVGSDFVQDVEVDVDQWRQGNVADDDEIFHCIGGAGARMGEELLVVFPWFNVNVGCSEGGEVG